MELLLAFYIHVIGLLILGVFSRSIVSKALCDWMGLGRREKKRGPADFVGALALLAPGAQRLLADRNDCAHQIGARLRCMCGALRLSRQAITLAVRTPDRAI